MSDYRSGSDNMNLNSNYPSMYPSPGGTTVGGPLPSPISIGGSVSLYNFEGNTFGHVFLRAYLNGSSSMWIDKLVPSSSPKTESYYHNGAVYGDDSHFEAANSKVYKNIVSETPSPPTFKIEVVQIKVTASQNGNNIDIKDFNGAQCYYESMLVVKKGNQPIDAVVLEYTTSEYISPSYTLDGNYAFELIESNHLYTLGTSSVSGWKWGAGSTSTTKSGSWNRTISAIPNKLYYEIVVDSEGTASGTLSLDSNGSWSNTIVGSGWKTLEFTGFSCTTSGWTMSFKKGFTSAPLISITLKAQYQP